MITGFLYIVRQMLLEGLYAVLLCSFLSNVGVSKNPATPALTRGWFPNT